MAIVVVCAKCGSEDSYDSIQAARNAGWKMDAAGKWSCPALTECNALHLCQRQHAAGCTARSSTFEGKVRDPQEIKSKPIKKCTCGYKETCRRKIPVIG